MKSFYQVSLILIAFLFSFTASAQITKPGPPPSYGFEDLKGHESILQIEKPDLTQILIEDAENEEMGFPSPPRMGLSFPIDINIEKDGEWTPLPGGGEIWRLSISIPDALALGVNFDQLYIPEGGELYFYNEDGTMISGAFTHESNTPLGVFSSDFIEGDHLTMEYFRPDGNSSVPLLNIVEVVYAYRDIWFNFNKEPERGGSWPCMINVACEEGEGWEDQIKGVTKLSIKIGFYYYWCSGSLINTTDSDRSPYVLTAAHCGEGASSNDLLYWKFYFNNEASFCGGNYGPTNEFLTGCTLKAHDPSYADAGSDFYLVLLNQSVPAGYEVFYNGWNRTNTPAPDSGVSIHHPSGDIKKISTYFQMISSSWWNGLPSHWRVQWATTVNGANTVQGGSSGSPVFDEDGYIMGDLTGGYQSNSCSNPSPAWYGKIHYSWDQNGSSSANRLKDWLDPGNTGVMKWPGIHHAVLPPDVDFTADESQVSQGEEVQFTDLTTGNPATSWMWVFEGGTPDTSYEQNPLVTYLDHGEFDVELTVTNPDGTDTELKADYITVDQVLPPEADFEAGTTEITEGESIDYTDLSTGILEDWTWAFEGGLPDTSHDQNPQDITYMEPGTYDVTLTATNIGGDDTEVKTDYILVNAGIAPTADFIADVTQIMTGDTVRFTDMSAGNPTIWIWSFDGGSPGGSGAQHPSVVYEEMGAYNVQLLAKNAYGSNTMMKEGYILVGPVTVGELNREYGVKVYPNPSRGTVNLLTGNLETENMTLYLFNSAGMLVNRIESERNVDRVKLNLENLEPGMYTLKIEAEGAIITRKISLIEH
jgi:PKD repeat protein